MGTGEFPSTGDGQSIRRKKRGVPESRRKYGKPESKKELLARLSRERAEKERERQMVKQASLKNPSEFHFGFYSHKPGMLKSRSMSRDELTKMLRYVDCEIKRCNSVLQRGISKVRVNKHTRFADDGTPAESVCDEGMHADTEPAHGESADTESDPAQPETEEQKTYEDYLRELREKRDEITAKLSKNK